MLGFLKPDYTFEAATEITPPLLKHLDVQCILVDLDNTLMPWNGRVFTQEVLHWLENLKAHGFKIVVISNSPWRRVKGLAQQLEVPAVKLSLKPLPIAIMRTLAAQCMSRKKVLLVGDQLLTDILAGKLAGIRTAWVKPISHKEFVWTKYVIRRIERFFARRWKIKR
ncbi:MAG: YqeG family HAD IIIA-type phosphatase [bacterium]